MRLSVWMAAAAALSAGLGVERVEAQSPPPSPPTAAAGVAAAFDKLDAWLGQGANGDRWRAYLHADALRGELVKGTTADPAVVLRTLQRLRGDAQGLELPPFRRAADALNQWLAELRQPLAANLADYARAVGVDHVPVTKVQFARVQQELRAAAQALAKTLSTNPAQAEAWKSYLLWPELEPHLAAEYQPTTASMARLGDVLSRFRTNEAGLELPVFQRVAAAIQKYRALAPWAITTRDSREVYQQYLDNLARVLDRHGERPTIETTRQVARGLGVVDALGQSPDFITAMRGAYAHPNVFGAVSANFVTRAPNRPVDRMTPVRDCILGTSIFGSAHAVGNVQYKVIPSDDTVELAVHLVGEAHSRTVGHNGPVNIHMTGVTQYWASKRISLSDDAFVAGPTTAGAELDSTINSIRKTGGQFAARLIEKIAWKVARKRQPRAERISASHTRARVVREFEETLARELALVRAQYEDRIRKPLSRRGVSPEYLRMNSAATGVSIETLFAGRSQLGAPGARPTPMPGHDMLVQIHESAINNYLPLALASARIAQDTADIPPSLKGNVPNWLKAMSIAQPKLAAAATAGVEMVEEAQARIADVVGAEPEPEPEVKPPPFKPYSITLNPEAPASVRFDDNRVIIRVRASELASEDSAYQNWDFVITYAIRHEGDRILLRREGDIEAFPTSFDPDWPRQLNAEETGFRSVLKKNMNARAAAGQSFPPEIPIEPVRFSRFGVLVLRELIADDGWLTVGWGLP